MIKHIAFFSLFVSLNAQAFEGMTLYSPAQGGNGGGGGTFYSYLIDNDLNVIKSWSHPYGAASMPYLNLDSTLVYPYRVPNPTMSVGGVGGGISIYSWEGDLIWDYEVSDEIYQHHHDVEPLPNGNILVVAWEKKTASEAYAAGRESIDNSLNEMWATAILELEPVGSNDANIVWEWHIWDHLIQDVDPNADNYGVVEDHPELQDVNYGNAGSNQGPGGANGDWKHVNAIAYNADLDQIAFSSRHHDEIYIIDHSTTTEEAAGHEGGNSGKGGDFLYRWGNPEAYGRGSNMDHLLDSQHGVNWIPNGYPGEGNLILFNNNYAQNSSAVFEIETPINENNLYDIEAGEPFGPDGPVWIHTGGFHTQMQGGAFRLPNGNTLISDCDDALMFEVTMDNDVVWEHDFGNNNVFIARGQKYPMDYLGGGFPDYTLGDVDFNGEIGILDLLYIADMALGIGYGSSPAADINEDGNITISDVILILQQIINN
ncbi:MAG: aryl-sulfate sulfotransferase [Candidatus Neomarinimicrobiota bacterium]